MGRMQDAMRRAAEDTAAKARTDSGGPEELAHGEFPPESAAANVPLRSDQGSMWASEAAAVGVAEVEPGLDDSPIPEAVSTPDSDPTAAPDDDLVLTPEGDSRPDPNAALLDRVDAKTSEKIVLHDQVMPASREQYRRLAAVLHNAQESTGLKVVMVTSAVMGEGKTLTASNLALTLSESYERQVLLIDADLRRPAVDGLFHIASPKGLIDGLLSPELEKLAVHRLSPHLSVLTAGRRSSDPMAGLTSPRMSQLIEEAREHFDWVVIDTPPVVLLPDAHLLASMVDGAVLVVRAATTPHDLVTRAVETVGKSRILGVVLNGTRRQDQPGHNYYGKYDYHYYNGEKRSSA